MCPLLENYSAGMFYTIKPSAAESMVCAPNAEYLSYQKIHFLKQDTILYTYQVWRK